MAGDFAFANIGLKQVTEDSELALGIDPIVDGLPYIVYWRRIRSHYNANPGEKAR